MKITCAGILFDADGVLVDSDAAVLMSWARWAQRRHLDADTVTEMVHGRRSADTVAILIDEPDRAQALEEINRYEIEDAAEVPACAGAAALLAALPAERWAVVTSGTRALATARLTAAGLPVPDVLVTADDVPRGKPDPIGYLTAARSLGLDPSHCVVFEDSPAGITAGRAAGAGVVGVTARATAADGIPVVHDLGGIEWTENVLTIPSASLLRGVTE